MSELNKALKTSGPDFSTSQNNIRKPEKLLIEYRKYD